MNSGNRPQELRGSTRLRSNALPPETLLLLRGGPQEVGDLIEQAEDSGTRYTLDGAPFYGLSVTAVLVGDTEHAVLAEPPMMSYPSYHRLTAGLFYAAGFEVWATFRNPRHHDVRLPQATEQSVRAFLAVAGRLRDNPYHRK